ncbi:MAG: isoaspartyl peptidase/L-asparaginase [Candidatus Thorarchaeota archaeon]|nr:MAG: isoaspartyl peptidase/L-asparaginase [Candidatus Thorarchaeota archaeon]
MPRPIVVVHGGATRFAEKHHQAILRAVKKAVITGMCVLDKGGSAIDSAEAAIWVLEDTNLFTAGRGAGPNRDGDIEVDAIVMDGNRLESGAVMAVRDIVHPISLARYVLERTPNSQIVGTGADKLYSQMISEGYRKEASRNRTLQTQMAEGCDTVGCVVVDSNGKMVAASSTSGWPGKLPGRVGDSPIIGAGVYANDIAAASCTGKGEQILRIIMGRMAVLFVEEGLEVQAAAEKAMQLLREKTSGEAGLIMADSNGNVAIGFDTTHMPVAVLGHKGDSVYSSMTPSWPLP